MPKFLVVSNNNIGNIVPAFVITESVGDVAALLFNTIMVVNLDDNTVFDQAYECWNDVPSLDLEDIVDPEDDNDFDEEDEDVDEDDVRYPAGAED